MATPNNDVYKQDVLGMDLKRIKKFYFDNGFFNTVIDTAVDYDEENMEVNIFIYVQEKERYKINLIKYEGLDSITPPQAEELKKTTLIKTGDYYSRSNLINEANWVTSYLQGQGYYYAILDSTAGTEVLKYETTAPPLNERVDVKLRFIGATHMYQFGDTKVNIIQNKYHIEDNLILRELDYVPGDLYRKERVLQSERNFSKLAIVQSGRITLDTTRIEKDRLNFIVKVTLNNKYELSPNVKGVDILNQFYLGAGLQYTDKNFFKGGRVFTTEINGLAHSKDVNRIELSSTLFQPFFFSNKVSAKFDLKFGILNFEDRKIYSLSNLSRFNYFIADYTFYNNIYTDVTVDVLRTKYVQDVVEDTILYKSGTVYNLVNSVIGFTVVHDNTNNIFHPSKGFFHSITLETAGLLPRLLNLLSTNITYSQYFKYYLPNRVYFDISHNSTSIIATKIIVGDIIEYGSGENIAPITDIYKFYSGGSTSLRGWGAKENGMVADPKHGGKFLLEGSLEHRWKLFAGAGNFLKNLWLVNFVDYGNIWEKMRFFKFSEVALAIGFGFRYDLFIGPLRLDFGFRLYDPKAIEGEKWLFQNFGLKPSKFAIQIGLGNAF